MLEKVPLQPKAGPRKDNVFGQRQKDFEPHLHPE